MIFYVIEYCSQWIWPPLKINKIFQILNIPFANSIGNFFMRFHSIFRKSDMRAFFVCIFFFSYRSHVKNTWINKRHTKIYQWSLFIYLFRHVYFIVVLNAMSPHSLCSLLLEHLVYNPQESRCMYVSWLSERPPVGRLFQFFFVVAVVVVVAKMEHLVNMEARDALFWLTFLTVCECVRRHKAVVWLTVISLLLSLCPLLEHKGTSTFSVPLSPTPIHLFPLPPSPPPLLPLY